MTKIKVIAKYFLYVAVLSIIMVSLKALVVAPGWWLYPDPEYSDERVWKNVTIDPVSAEAQASDNKSPVFLLLMHLLRIDQTVLYTRLLNWLIYSLMTYLIYRQTKRKKAVFVLVFMAYTDLPILYDVTLELAFILLALNLPQYQGALVGLAGIFRPYAFAYTVLLSKRQAAVTVGFGMLLVLLMYLTGGLVNYWQETTAYGVDHDPYWLRYSTFFESAVIITLAILTWSPKDKTFQFGCVSCLPLLVRTYGHYYTIPVVIFYYLYLKQQHLLTVDKGENK